MKKLLLSAAMACVGMLAQAQLVTVESINRVDLPDDIAVFIPTISPDGTFVVASDLATTAINHIDLATLSTRRIAENGSGLNLLISPDGQTVTFRHDIVDARHLRHTGLQSVNLRSGAVTQVVAPSRNMGGFAYTRAGEIAAVADGRMRTRTHSAAQPVVSINRGHLDVTIGETTTTIDPQGRGSYLWPTVSPDGTKICYYKALEGCFVCDLDGKNVRPIGYLHAAKWLDNNTVVGCRDFDDGSVLTASSIVAVSLDGREQELTGSDIIAINPSATADGKHIAFATDRGELYIITLR